MHSETLRYKTRSRRYFFRFEFAENGGLWTIYILEQPPYGWQRSKDAHSTHRYFSPRPHICWSEPIRSFDDAKKIASKWAECTETYILYGTRF